MEKIALAWTLINQELNFTHANQKCISPASCKYLVASSTEIRLETSDTKHADM